MLSVVKSMALHGLNGYVVSIQVDVSNGLPGFEIVGLPGVSVRESKERVKTAIKNSEYKLRSQKIVVNLAPANTRKEGSMFDLPIAVGILIAMGEVEKEEITKILKETIFIGELSLQGTVEKVNGILPICIEAKKLGIKKIVLPLENEKEAKVIKGLEIFSVKDIKQVINFIEGKIEIKEGTSEKINIEPKYDVDFSEVKGQENVKRALEIAAAGRA